MKMLTVHLALQLIHYPARTLGETLQ